MKFTDGYWEIKPGYERSVPTEIREIRRVQGGLELVVAHKAIESRADALNVRATIVRVSTPLSGVLKIATTFRKGSAPRSPSFQVTADPSAVLEIADEGGRVSVSSGRLSAVFTKKPYSVDFYYDLRRLTGSPPRALADFRLVEEGGSDFREAGGAEFTREQLTLGVGESVYGLGERFGPLVKNGQSIDTWNEDGGTSSEIAYKNIPFYLSSGGYGVFVPHPERVSFEVASEAVSRVQFSVAGPVLEYYLIGGTEPKDALRSYAALTGRPALPPAWSFGLWLSTSFLTDYSEKTVLSFLDRMKEEGIPVRVFHFDCFWMKEFHWCDFEWDREMFPDPKGMLARIRESGVKVCVWINPYLSQASPVFDEAASRGYLLKTADGGVWQTDKWQPGMGIVDFTNPAAASWYQSKLEALLDMGVDCFKTDFGERIPMDVVYSDRSDPERMHNYYALIYNRLVFRTIERKKGIGEAVVFARSATTGGQSFPVHWGGDSTSNFESMAETLRGGLSLALGAFGFWSHDIGGFEEAGSPEVYKRWSAFGLLSSHSRLHGSGGYRVPWAYDDEAVAVLRFFARLKNRLMPYLYRAAVEAAAAGVPMLRPIFLEYPADQTARYADRQYFLGPSLLVSPVFSAAQVCDFYLPGSSEDEWIDLVTGVPRRGGRWHAERFDFMSLSIAVRPCSVIPIGTRSDRADYEYADGVELHAFGLRPGTEAAAEVPSPDGRSLTRYIVSVDADDNAEVRTEGPSLPYRLVRRNAGSILRID